MFHTSHHSPSARIKIKPLARRLLGDARPDTPYLLELLAVFAMQRHAAPAADFPNGKEYNAYCRRRCLEVTALKELFSRFTALRGRDADLVEANVQKSLTITQDADDDRGWTLTYTPTQGSNYRRAIAWLVERACVNLEHRAKAAQRDAVRELETQAKAARAQQRNERFVEQYNRQHAEWDKTNKV
jgi:hypothetical protein